MKIPTEMTNDMMKSRKTDRRIKSFNEYLAEGQITSIIITCDTDKAGRKVEDLITRMTGGLNYSQFGTFLETMYRVLGLVPTDTMMMDELRHLAFLAINSEYNEVLADPSKAPKDLNNFLSGIQEADVNAVADKVMDSLVAGDAIEDMIADQAVETEASTVDLPPIGLPSPFEHRVSHIQRFDDFVLEQLRKERVKEVIDMIDNSSYPLEYQDLKDILQTQSQWKEKTGDEAVRGFVSWMVEQSADDENEDSEKITDEVIGRLKEKEKKGKAK